MVDFNNLVVFYDLFKSVNANVWEMSTTTKDWAEVLDTILLSTGCTSIAFKVFASNLKKRHSQRLKNKTLKPPRDEFDWGAVSLKQG